MTKEKIHKAKSDTYGRTEQKPEELFWMSWVRHECGKVDTHTEKTSTEMAGERGTTGRTILEFERMAKSRVISTYRWSCSNRTRFDPVGCV